MNVFLAYAHEDDLLREQLRKRLSLLRRLGLIHVWYDGDIGAGTEWQEAIKSHLDTAHLILLLISPDFIDSDYCYSVEMTRALERHDAKEARVIPIILRHSPWKRTPIGKLKALPKDGKPVRSWQDEDEALLNVAEGIEKAARELLALQWYREGDALCESRQFEEALAAFQQAIKEALAAFEEHAKLDSEYAVFYRRKGDALWGLGRFEHTLEAFEQAITLDPKNVVAYISKGWVLNDLKRYEEALAASNQAIRLDPNAARAYQGKGWALYHLKQYEEALVVYEQAIRLGYDSSDPFYEIVRGLHALGVTQVSTFEHGSTQDGRGQYWHYPEMSVYWSPETGIHAVRGQIRDKWESLDWEHGILGYPTTDVEGLADQVGQHCHFQHGSIYWSPETGAHEVHGPIRDKWASLGWEQSFLGYPVADEKGSPDGIGRISNFQHGSIYWTPQTEVYAVFGEMRDKWESLRWELGPLGYPIGDQEPTTDNIGRHQHFQGGSIYWFPETGTHTVHGPIRDKWASLGWEHGILGYPTTDVEELPDQVGHHCHFQHGCIYWSPKTDAHEVRGPIRDKWAYLGWEQSFLGYPVSDEMGTRDKIGTQSHFQHGSIYWTPTTGAHEVHGIIREKWFSLDKNYGILKYPISDQEPTEDDIGCYQHFQEGYIFWSPDTGAHEVHGAIWEKWQLLKCERGILGYPTSDEIDFAADDGVRRYSHFQHGSIYYHGKVGSSIYEVYVVHGPIRDKWASLGWEQSFLGYPIEDEMQAPDGLGSISYFQYGAIYLSDIADAVVLRGRGQDLRECFTNSQEFALALEQARKPVPTTLTAVIYHIDHPSEQNCGHYRIGRNLDANGIAAGGWSKPLPRGLKAREHQGAGIALVELDGSGCPDMLIFRIDQSEQKNRGYYRVGRNLRADGTAVGGWSETIRVPDPFGKQNLGAGIALADLDRSGRPDLLVFYIECSEDERRDFYRVGRNLDSNGQVTGGWSEPIQVPGGFGTEQYCVGIALADLDGNGRPDLVIFSISHQEGENRAYYHIGKHLDSDGVVTDGWSEPISVPGSFGRQNHGASIAIADLSRNGRPDLVIFYIEHPADEGENSGYYRIGKNLDANGYATGGWSERIQVPGWFGTMNQGAGIAFTTLL